MDICLLWLMDQQMELTSCPTENYSLLERSSKEFWKKKWQLLAVLFGTWCWSYQSVLVFQNSVVFATLYAHSWGWILAVLPSHDQQYPVFEAFGFYSIRFFIVAAPWSSCLLMPDNSCTQHQTSGSNQCKKINFILSSHAILMVISSHVTEAGTPHEICPSICQPFLSKNINSH